MQRGRGPDPTAVARRKLVTREVKSVRERLTSSTGLERAFDNELLRVFAEYRMNGSVGTLILALAVTKGRLTAPEAWTLSRIDETWQTEQWGADEEATTLEEARHAALLHAGRFYLLCG